MAINTLVKQLCREEEVGFVDLWVALLGGLTCSRGMGSISLERVQQCLQMNSYIFLLTNII